ncbi:TetR/AcrR family transcriptional regulator [Glaciibacter flavus]|uniref:TetR/AcrR family transcriptional regulator n=1 Tax=Orlajensenia flava TaxID=2565934 RepID=UPI003AFFBB39
MSSDAPSGSSRARPSDELRSIALDQFSSVGYAGTSLQQIADVAGYSKSSVLYHFASKEALLDAVLTPAIDELQRVMAIWLSARPSEQSRAAFVESFVDFLLRYRLEVHTFINQGAPLEDVPVVARANALIARLSDAVSAADSSLETKLRFGIALGGAAYTLTAGLTYADSALQPDDELRGALIRIVSELLSTVPPTR